MMNGEFFTWDALASYAGATLLVTLVTQFVKQIKWLQNVPTQLIAYVVALLGLLGGTYFTVGLTWETGLLAAINAVVVCVCSNGTYDNIKDIKG